MRADVVKSYPFIERWRSKGFQYLVVPKTLLQESEKLGLSKDAVFLYVLLIDRTKLSNKNNWLDDHGRLYIKFTREAVARYMGWSLRKTISVFSNLVEKGFLTEVAQKNTKKMNTAKRLYVRLWTDLEHSLLQQNKINPTKPLDRPYITPHNISSTIGNYYIIPKVLLEDEVFSGLSFRSIMIYVIALDNLHMSITYNNVDSLNRVWCTLDKEQIMRELDCKSSSITTAYKELETIGLMCREKDGYGGSYRIYLRDYLPSADSIKIDLSETDIYSHKFAPPYSQNLHVIVPKNAPHTPKICTSILPKFAP